MRKSIFLITLVLAGCGGRGGFAPLELRATTTVDGNYQAIADCMYLAINDDMKTWSAAVITKADFPSKKEARISAVANSVDLWELQIAETPSGKTDVRQLGTMSLGGPQRVPGFEQKLAACSRR